MPASTRSMTHASPDPQEKASWARLSGSTCIATLATCPARGSSAHPTGHNLRFWERGRKTATPRAAEHFLAGFTAYLRSVVREAEARDSGIVLTTEAYLAIRLENIGVHSLCAMGELLLSIPDALYYHPLLARMMEIECEMVAIDNVSSCSYRR